MNAIIIVACTGPRHAFFDFTSCALNTSIVLARMALSHNFFRHHMYGKQDIAANAARSKKMLLLVEDGLLARGDEAV